MLVQRPASAGGVPYADRRGCLGVRAVPMSVAVLVAQPARSRLADDEPLRVTSLLWRLARLVLALLIAADAGVEVHVVAAI